MDTTHQSSSNSSASASPIGWVHSTEAGSCVDGPGWRFLVFLSGCSYRCTYCHNPDTWHVQAGHKRNLDSVLHEIGTYAAWLRKKGGVTISGGEPLQQPRFVKLILDSVKERWGLHTAIETSGFMAPRLPDEWFAPLDLVLMDLKHIDDAAHRAITGGYPVAPSLETARRFSEMEKEMWIRHVILPNSTDTMDVAERMADFVAELRTVTRVELLPFHQLGKDKWKALGIPYSLENVKPPDPEWVEKLREPFRQRGFLVC